MRYGSPDGGAPTATGGTGDLRAATCGLPPGVGDGVGIGDDIAEAAGVRGRRKRSRWCGVLDEDAALVVFPEFADAVHDAEPTIEDGRERVAAEVHRLEQSAASAVAVVPTARCKGGSRPRPRRRPCPGGIAGTGGGFPHSQQLGSHHGGAALANEAEGLGQGDSAVPARGAGHADAPVSSTETPPEREDSLTPIASASSFGVSSSGPMVDF